MTTLQLVELSDQDRKTAWPLGKLGKGDQVEVRVRRKSGKDQIVKLPAHAATLLESALSHLLQRNGTLSSLRIGSSAQTMRPDILGISHQLVVHPMDIGDLPFRYVGNHRRTKLTEVLALKIKIDARQAAMEAYLAVENIDHNRTKVKSPQTNSIVERFYRTVLNEFYRVAFRRKIYRALGELQADLDQ